jgi:hypothetical protein
MFPPVGGNISALISTPLLKHPHTVLKISAPSGCFIAAFAAGTSPIGKTAGAIVFYQGFALAAAGTSFVFGTVTATGPSLSDTPL